MSMCLLKQSKADHRSPQISDRNCDGFVVPTLVVLLPLILAMISVIAVALLVIQSDAKLRHLCRTHLLFSQAQIAETLRNLLKLNPKASRLRLARARVEKALALSPSPVVSAALEAKLALIAARQTALAAEQKFLIFSAKKASLYEPSKIAIGLRSAAQDELTMVSSLGSSIRITAPSASSILKNEASKEWLEVQFKPGMFPVTASPASSLTPDYQPSVNFSDQQTMTVALKIRFLRAIPNWLQAFANLEKDQRDFLLETGCSATIEQTRGEKWQANLKADK